jgi:hypothetical protein
MLGNSPGVAAIPTSGDLYFQAVAVKDPGEIQPGGTVTSMGTTGHADNLQVPSLMFGAGEKYTSKGEAVVGPAVNPGVTKGSWKEVLNFHGSPAPWVLIGILLVAGILHLQAGAKVGKHGFGITL